MNRDHKLFKVLLASSLLLPGFAPLSSGVKSVSAATELVSNKQVQYVAMTEEVVRHRAAENAAPVALINEGDKITYLEEVNDKWFKVRAEKGEVGYILRGNVTSEKNYKDQNKSIHNVPVKKEETEKTYTVAVRTALRTKDEERYQPIIFLERGDVITYEGTTDNNWFKVSFGDLVGYVKREDLTKNKNMEAGQEADLSYDTYRQEADPALDYLRTTLTTAIRTQPGTQYSVIDQIDREIAVKYLGTVTTNNQWFLVDLGDGVVGYLDRSHVTKVESEDLTPIVPAEPKGLEIESLSAVNGKVTATFEEEVTDVPEGLAITVDGEALELDAKVVDGKVEISIPKVEPSEDIVTEVEYAVSLGNCTETIKIMIPAKLSPIEMRTVESIEELADLDIEFGNEYQLPKKVNVTLSDQETVQVPVKWDDAKVDVKKPSSYDVVGKLDLSNLRNLKDRETQQTTTIRLNVMEKVLTKLDLEDLIDSIEYVDVSEDGLDIDADKEWTNKGPKNNLEQTVAKVGEMLADEEYDHAVKKGETLSLETGTFYRKIDGEWIVKGPSILKIEETGSYSSSFGSSIRIVYTVKVSGLKQGYSQLEYTNETGEVLSSTIIKVVDESIPEFTQEELRSAMKELTEAVDNYESAKKSGNKLSPTDMLQAAKDAVTKAEENKTKSDIYVAKRLVDLLPITEEKESLENRLENLMLEVAVPVTLLAYTGTSKEVEIPKFIDSQKIVEGRYEDFEIEGNLGADDLAVVERIEGYAFYDLGLTEIVIPDTVKEIGAYSFGNNDLTELTIPANLSFIAPYSFYNAFKYSRTGENQLVIPDTVKEIGENAFPVNNLGKLVLPEGLEKIGSRAFSTNNLKTVALPDSITKIGNSVFSNNELESIYIPETVTEIGNSAFSDNELESIDLPDTVTEIGSNAFYNNKLKEIDIPAGISVLSNGVFSNNRLRTVSIPKNIKEIGYNAFDKNILTKMILPDNIKIGREILGSNNQLRDEYENEGKSAGIYTGTQYGEWTKQSE